MKILNWFFLISILGVLMLFSILVFSNFYFFKMTEYNKNMNKSLKNTEEDYKNYSKISSFRNNLQESIQKILAIGYINDKNKAEDIYQEFYSEYSKVKNSLENIEEKKELEKIFEDIEKIIEKLIKLKNEELELRYRMEECREKNIIISTDLDKINEKIFFQKNINQSKISELFKKFNEIKNEFKNSPEKISIENIDKEFIDLKIKKLTIYEIEECFSDKEISKITTKYKEISELKYFTREVFIINNEKSIDFIKDINKKADIIISSIYLLNSSGYFAMDIYQERIIMGLLYEYVNKVEELVVFKKELLKKDKEFREISEEIYSIQKKIDKNKEESLNIINKKLHEEIQKVSKLLTPYENTLNKSTRDNFLNVFKINAEGREDIKTGYYRVMIILITSLFFIGIISIFILKKTNRELENINKNLEKNIEMRTGEIKENNNRLRLIQKTAMRIYNEKESNHAIEVLLSVMATSDYYKRAVYLKKDENNYDVLNVINVGLNLHDVHESNNEDTAYIFNDEIKNKKLKLNECYFLENAFEEVKVCEFSENEVINFVDKYKMENFITVSVFYYEENIKKIYGIIVLEKKEKNTIIPEMEKEALKIFAGTLATYFEKIKLEEEKSKNEKLEILLSLSSSIVHELRTPITTILGFAKMLKMRYLEEPKLQKYSDYIIKECYRIDDMATELLDYSASNSLEHYKFEKIYLNEFIQEVFKEWENEFFSNGAEIILNLKTEKILKADKEKLKKVFNHIIKNSLESFNKKKNYLKITLSEKEKTILITFEDNGKGIEKEVLENIFEPLVSSKVQGTGLGLAIVKNVIKAHNGKIDIDSEKEIGTKLNLYL